MTLKAPPASEWGKVVEGARGEFQFHDTFKGGFLVNVKLEGLTPGEHIAVSGTFLLDSESRMRVR